MANNDNPRGLVAFMQDGKTPRVEKFFHTSGDSTAIGIGDTVLKTGTARTNTDATPIVAAGGANGVASGVAINYVAADANGDVYAYTDPQQVYVIQDDASTTSAVTLIGLNCDITATAVHTTSGQSRYELNTTSAATGADVSLKIIGIDKRVDNAMGDHCDWLVRLNENTEGDNTVGV